MTGSDGVVYVVRADYGDEQHADAIIALLDEYAAGDSGGGEPLAESVRRELVPALARSVNAITLLALVDAEPVGVLNAFESLSTFRAKPLLNIHDVAVTGRWRRRGVGRALLAEIERIAVERDCCKLTLEVLEGNVNAQRLYRDIGFDAYTLRSDFGRALFWQKYL